MDISTLLAPVTKIAASGAAQSLAPTGPFMSVFDVTETANGCVYSLAPGVAVAGYAFGVRLIRRQDATGGRQCVLPSPMAVNYPYVQVPTVSTAQGTHDVFDFVTTDGGVTWDCVGYAVSLSPQAVTLGAFSGTNYVGGSISLAGAYYGPAPTNIDYQVVNASTAAVVQAWQTATGATIQNGAYAATGTLPSAAGNYQVLVRETNNTAVVSSPQAITANPVAAPSGNSLTSFSGNGKALVSGSVSTNGATPTVPVYRGTASGGESTTALGNATINSVVNGVAYYSYEDDTAANSSTYFYTTNPTNSAGAESASVTAAAAGAEVSATPTTTPAHYLATSGSPSGSCYTSGTNQGAAQDPNDGFIDVVVEVNLSTYAPSQNSYLASNADAPGGTGSQQWAFELTTAGKLEVETRDNSGNQTYASATSSVALSTLNSGNGPSGIIYLRAVINQNASATSDYQGVSYPAGTATFYTAPDGATWTQFGTQATSLLKTGLNKKGASDKGFCVGQGSSSTGINGKVYGARVVDGTGKVIANPKFWAMPTTAAGKTFYDTAATPNYFTLSSPDSIA